MTPVEVAQLVVVIVGCALTIATVLYKFGQLEGTVLTTLKEHERRIGALEGDERRWYVRRADDQVVREKQ